VQHIPVLHDVCAFEAQDAFGTGVGFTASYEDLVRAARSMPFPAKALFLAVVLLRGRFVF
jgi:hypothetical protein